MYTFEDLFSIIDEMNGILWEVASSEGTELTEATKQRALELASQSGDMLTGSGYVEEAE